MRVDEATEKMMMQTTGDAPHADLDRYQNLLQSLSVWNKSGDDYGRGSGTTPPLQF